MILGLAMIPQFWRRIKLLFGQGLPSVMAILVTVEDGFEGATFGNKQLS
jgi:hypothetical protein